MKNRTLFWMWEVFCRAFGTLLFSNEFTLLMVEHLRTIFFLERERESWLKMFSCEKPPPPDIERLTWSNTLLRVKLSRSGSSGVQLGVSKYSASRVLYLFFKWAPFPFKYPHYHSVLMTFRSSIISQMTVQCNIFYMTAIKTQRNFAFWRILWLLLYLSRK